MDVIQSKNEYSLKNSVGQLKGSVRKTVQQIREKLLYHIAYIESALDDPEHYDLTGYSEELEQIVAEEKEKIQNLLKTAGVDLTTPLPVTVTLHKFAEKLQELKTLLGK